MAKHSIAALFLIQVPELFGKKKKKKRHVKTSQYWRDWCGEDTYSSKYVWKLNKKGHWKLQSSRAAQASGPFKIIIKAEGGSGDWKGGSNVSEREIWACVCELHQRMYLDMYTNWRAHALPADPSSVPSTHTGSSQQSAMSVSENSGSPSLASICTHTSTQLKLI